MFAAPNRTSRLRVSVREGRSSSTPTARTTTPQAIKDHAAGRLRPRAAPSPIRATSAATRRNAKWCCSCPLVVQYLTMSEWVTSPAALAHEVCPMFREETVENSATTRRIAEVAERARTAHAKGPEALILPGIPAPRERGRTADALLSSAAASGVVTRPPSGSSKRPPYGESVPHGDEDLF